MYASRRNLTPDKRMSLFQPDLFRNFGIGFVVGAVLVGVQAGTYHWDSIAPAIAAILPA